MGAGASLRALAAKKTSEDILKVNHLVQVVIECPHAVPVVSRLSPHEWLTSAMDFERVLKP